MKVSRNLWILTKRCTSILIFWNCLLHHMLTLSHCAGMTQQSVPLVNLWKKKKYIQKKTCKINLNAWNSSSCTGQSVGLSEFPGSVTANRLTQSLHFLSFQTWWGHTFVGEQIQCKFPQSNSAPGLFFLPYTLLRIEANVWAARGHLCCSRISFLPVFLMKCISTVQHCAKVDGGKKSGQKERAEHAWDH